MRRLLLSAALLGGFALAVSAADPKTDAKKIVISDPAKLKDDPDYAIQGEYVYPGDGPTAVAVQVIARGGGKFDIVGYNGGLPGAGATGDARRMLTAVRDGDTVNVLKDKEVIGSIGDGVYKMDRPKNPLLFKRVERKSPTLGAKPPEGAVVLFAGPKDEDRWQNGKLLALSDGAFLAANNVRSHETFHSFTAHVEFRLAYMPGHTGQGRSNSGVYVQDRYEVQVLDSFGLKGLNNECGGVYTVAAPSVNMCLPPMVWQTYDIDFTAARFDAAGQKTAPARLTLRHNGVTVHDKLELRHTPGGKFAKEGPEPGSLFLQNHGDPVVFNNVWAVHTK